MDIRSTVILTIQTVAARRDISLDPLDETMPLLESGLDSLDMATLVAQLEDELDVDPFDTDDEFVFPVTIGEFITLYERAAQQPER